MKTAPNSTPQFARIKSIHVNDSEKSNVPESSRNTVMQHLISLQDNDLDSVVADYTNESVLITPFAAYKGQEEIKSFFTDLIRHFPKQKSRFELDKVVVNNDMVYIVWHANTPSLEVSFASDTFILKGGKIHQQTFAGELNYIHG